MRVCVCVCVHLYGVRVNCATQPAVFGKRKEPVGGQKAANNLCAPSSRRCMHRRLNSYISKIACPLSMACACCIYISWRLVGTARFADHEWPFVEAVCTLPVGNGRRVANRPKNIVLLIFVPFVLLSRVGRAIVLGVFGNNRR